MSPICKLRRLFCGEAHCCNIVGDPAVIAGLHAVEVVFGEQARS